MQDMLTARLFDDADHAGLDPFALFDEWLALARQHEINDPHAMALASVDSDGLPDVRMVLLNAHDARGFCFFTNFGSEKGQQLLAQPKAAMVMHWKSLRRQVRVRGKVEVVSAEEADAYFASRPVGSQIASSVSDQSRPLASREVLLARVAALTADIEFWKDGEFRLHDRVRFTREGENWSRARLYP
jgi:pyridoxamine 5'-phosphate oxidase